MTFPFSAVVGQEELKKSLTMLAVDRNLSGLLIEGPRGTAKSTLVRALPELLPEQPVRQSCPYRCHPESPPEQCPHCSTVQDHSVEYEQPPVVTLPLGADRDTVLGSLSLDDAMREGKRRLQPGLLARAHRGFLYVDEVNLLGDPLVDILLDVASSGVHRIAREGISVEHPAEFQLIGSMNPREGHLRPQFLDRFALGVKSETLSDPKVRVTLSRRVEKFQNQPDQFRDHYQSKQQQLKSQIQQAREQRSGITIPDELEQELIHRAMEYNTPGHRADIYLRKASLTLAALNERNRVTRQDIDEVVPLVLPHRSQSNQNSTNYSENNPNNHDPFDPNADPSNPPEQSANENHDTVPEDEPDQTTHSSGNKQKHQDPDQDWSKPHSHRQTPSPPSSTHFSHNYSDFESQYSKRPKPETTLDVNRTIRKNLEAHREIPPGSIKFPEPWFRTKPTQPKQLVAGVLDLSGSMLKNQNLGKLKQDFLNETSTQSGSRYRYALFSVRDQGLESILTPTENLNRVRSAIHSAQAGGPTPMETGLAEYLNWLQRWTRENHHWPVITRLYTDGRFPRNQAIHQAMQEIKQISSVEINLSDASL